MSDVSPSLGSLVVGFVVAGAILSPLEWWLASDALVRRQPVCL